MTQLVGTNCPSASLDRISTARPCQVIQSNDIRVAMVNHVIQPSGPNYTNIHASKTICFSASHYNHNVGYANKLSRPTISDWSRKDAFVSSRLNYLIRCCLACLTAFFEDFRLYKALQHVLLLILECEQWWRQSVSCPGHLSVLPPSPIRSGYFSGFQTWGCEPTLTGPRFSPHLSFPITLYFPRLLLQSIRSRPIKFS